MWNIGGVDEVNDGGVGFTKGCLTYRHGHRPSRTNQLSFRELAPSSTPPLREIGLIWRRPPARLLEQAQPLSALSTAPQAAFASTAFAAWTFRVTVYRYCWLSLGTMRSCKLQERLAKSVPWWDIRCVEAALREMVLSTRFPLRRAAGGKGVVLGMWSWCWSCASDPASGAAGRPGGGRLRMV